MAVSIEFGNGIGPIEPGEIGAAELDSAGKVVSDQLTAIAASYSANHTLQLSDSGKFLLAESAGSIAITVPAESTLVFPEDTEIEICQRGAGTVTFVAASGVTILSLDGALSIAGQYGCAVLKYLGSNNWILAGALA